MPKHDVSILANGKFYKAFEEIPESECLPFMTKYRTKLSEPQTTAPEYQMTDTSMPPLRRGSWRRMSNTQKDLAEMAGTVRQEDLLDEELAQEREREDERLKPIIENLRAEHQATVELQKKQMEVDAQRADELRDDIIREKEQRLKEEGFYNVASTGDENGDSDSEPEPEGRGVSVRQESEAAARHPVEGKSKTPKRSNLFVRRDGKYIRSSEVTLMPNEDLYRLRPRTFGKAQKWIRHGKHQIK